MREETWKRAVEKVASNAGYSSNSIACEKALRQDTAEGYRDALKEIARHPYYAVNDEVVKQALKE